MRWERFQLDFPNDFPVSSIDALHAYLSDRNPNANKSVEWLEWATGLNGVVHRFIGCDAHGEAAITSLRLDEPGMDKRHRQEDALFAFFFDGLSCLECLYYGLYFVGCLADPANFNVNINRRDVVPRLVVTRFSDHFAGEVLTQRLDAIKASTDYNEWLEIRNFLSHRGIPGRTFYEGGEQHGTVDWNMPIQKVDISKLLEPDDLQRRRDWLGVAVTEIVAGAESFAQQHVP